MMGELSAVWSIHFFPSGVKIGVRATWGWGVSGKYVNGWEEFFF